MRALPGAAVLGLSLGVVVITVVCGTSTDDRSDTWLPPSNCTSCTPANAVLRDARTGVSLEQCKSLCVATPGCRYINVVLPPGNGACQLFADCRDPQRKPSCGGWWTMYGLSTRLRAVWAPAEAGFTGKVKPFWFGANRTGLDDADTLALMAKHTVAGYGWQTGGAIGPSSVGRGDANGAAAVAHVRDYLAEVNNTHTTVFQYRQIQVALRLFSQPALAADDPALNGFWLTNQTTGAACLAQQPWGTRDPYWNFENESAMAFWVDRVIGQLAADSSMQGGRVAVFFDEVDQGQCGYRGGTCEFSQFNQTALQAAEIAMLPKMVAALNGAGIVPILSLDNRVTASGEALPGLAPPCALPEDDVVAALDGLTWVRFYENWPGTFWAPGGPDTVAAMIANAVAEAASGVPTVLHAHGTCPAPQRNISRPGRLGGVIEFAIASYLVVASPGSTLSVSDGWYDADFCWWPEFDVEYGTPVGPPQRTGSHTWVRNFTRANVAIDVSTPSQVGEVMLL